MEPKEFRLSIEMGNQTMQTDRDVAEALERIVSQLEQGFTFGVILDSNGNQVGEWDFPE